MPPGIQIVSGVVARSGPSRCNKCCHGGHRQTLELPRRLIELDLRPFSGHAMPRHEAGGTHINCGTKPSPKVDCIAHERSRNALAGGYARKHHLPKIRNWRTLSSVGMKVHWCAMEFVGRRPFLAVDRRFNFGPHRSLLKAAIVAIAYLARRRDRVSHRHALGQDIRAILAAQYRACCARSL